MRVRCLLTCDSYRECGCLCVLVCSVCGRRRETERAREHLWKPKCEWQLGAQRAPSVRFACAVRCVHVATSVCVCESVPWQSRKPGGKNQAAHHGTARVRCSADLQQAPTIWHMSAHTPKTHIGHVSAARGPLADHKPQDRSEPADDTRCQSDWAAHTHLQRWK